MSAITEILYEKIKDNQKLIKSNTDLIGQLLERIIELEKPSACAELYEEKTPLP